MLGALANESKRRLLLVGGQSRAALAFRRYLANCGRYRVAVLTRRPENPHPEETIIEVRDYFNTPDHVLAKADAIINFAGVTRASNESTLMFVNALGPERLATRAKQLGVKQFVHLSSLSVYGGARDIGPDTPERPLSVYGRSKKECDDRLRALQSSDFPITLWRVPVLYGPEMGGKLKQLATWMARVRWLPVPKMEQERSLLHVDNLALVLEIAVDLQLRGVQFAADPDDFTLPAMAAAVSKHTTKLVYTTKLPAATFTPLQYAAPAVYRSLYDRNVIVRAARLPSSTCALPDFASRMASVLKSWIPL